MARSTHARAKIFGLDFTSAPSERKPITCAHCLFQNGTLTLKDLRTLPSFAEFELFLETAGRWLAAIDFPFGQSRRLIDNLGWTGSWADYVNLVGGLSKLEFMMLLEAYKKNRPPGDKHHKRAVDTLAGSQSPQSLYGVPAGKMFYEGAPRLLHSTVNLLPCRPTDSGRFIFEGYPALVAEKFGHKRGYKAARNSKGTVDHRKARVAIVNGLLSPSAMSQHYGFNVALTGLQVKTFVEDWSGDSLDSLLCAVQAAWAFSRRNSNNGRYGIPTEVDCAEGWIVDPDLID